MYIIKCPIGNTWCILYMSFQHAEIVVPTNYYMVHLPVATAYFIASQLKYFGLTFFNKKKSDISDFN